MRFDAIIFVAAVAFAFVVGNTMASGVAREQRVRAETAELALGVLAADRDSIKASNAILTRQVQRQDSLIDADSALWEMHRQTERAIAERESRNHRQAADSLRTLVDAATGKLVTEMVTAHRLAIEALENEVAALETERARLFDSRRSLQELVAGLEAENDANRAMLAQQSVALAAWQDVANPSVWQRIQGAAPQVATGVVIGAVAGLVLVR